MFTFPLFAYKQCNHLHQIYKQATVYWYSSIFLHLPIGAVCTVPTIFTSVRKSTSDCENKMYACTKMVKPMLNDVQYMFPTSLEDVETMCKTWSHLVDCVRRFMSSCSTRDQRWKFNKAVGHSVDTVHAICSSDKHQKEYLENAHCFRRVSVENCGYYYRRLILQVENEADEETHICCAYGQFKSCVSAPLLRNCGMKVHILLDHSLSYLVNICSNTFYPMSYKCPVVTKLLPLSKPLSTLLLPASTMVMEVETSTSVSVVSSVSKPRTIIYTLPPEQGSRTSSSSEIIVFVYSFLLNLLVFFFCIVRQNGYAL